MARRVLVTVLGVWLTVLTIIAVHLLVSRTKVSVNQEPELRHRQAGNDGDMGYSRVDAPPKAERRLEKPENIASMVNTLLHKTDESDPRAAFERVIALSTLLPKITNISRLKTPSPTAFRNYIAPVGLPVIFTDMLDGSRLQQWSWDYIKDKWGHHVFRNTRQGNYSSKKSSSGKYYVNRVTVTLADFINVVTGKREPMKSEKDLYITKQSIIPTEELETEFLYPPFYPGGHKNCYLEPTAW